MCAHSTLLDRMDPKAKEFAAKWLHQNGVEVVTGTRIRWGAPSSCVKLGLVEPAVEWSAQGCTYTGWRARASGGLSKGLRWGARSHPRLPGSLGACWGAGTGRVAGGRMLVCVADVCLSLQLPAAATGVGWRMTTPPLPR